MYPLPVFLDFLEKFINRFGEDLRADIIIRL